MRRLLLHHVFALCFGIVAGGHPAIACYGSGSGALWDLAAPPGCMSGEVCCRWWCDDPNLGPPPAWAQCFDDIHTCDYYEMLYQSAIC